VQRRLVVPDVAVQFESLQAKRGLGEFKAFIGADLNGRVEREPTLEGGE